MFDAWMSVYGTVKNGGTRPGVGGFTVGPKIDHIPVSEGIVPLEVRVDRRKIGGRKASDHWPVIAKVELESLGGTSPVAKKTDGDYQVFN
jgi:endonuclease/exonuclease/phosphatase family metal-dependent hydrolase